MDKSVLWFIWVIYIVYEDMLRQKGLPVKLSLVEPYNRYNIFLGIIEDELNTPTRLYIGSHLIRPSKIFANY